MNDARLLCSNFVNDHRDCGGWSGEAVVYIVKDPSAGWGEGLLSGSLVGDRPSVGTVRRGWFPSKHTTCKRQLPDTRPHQAIVTVSSSSLHLPFPPVSPISSDPSSGSRAAVCTAQPSLSSLSLADLFLLPRLAVSRNVRSYGRTQYMYRRVLSSSPSTAAELHGGSRSREERKETEREREREDPPSRST